MNITEKTKFQLEVDENQLQVIKEALSDHATQWLLFSTNHKDPDVSKGGMVNFHRVAAVRDLFNEHYKTLINNQDS